MDNQTTESDWSEWKEKCAFELCSEEAKGRFIKFCSVRVFNPKFSKQIRDLYLNALSQVGINQDIEPSLLHKRILSFVDAQFRFQKFNETDPGSKNKKVLKDWLIQAGKTIQEIEKLVTKRIWAIKDGENGLLNGEWMSRQDLSRKTNYNEDFSKKSGVNYLDPSQILRLEELEKELYAKGNEFFLELTRDRQISFLAKYLNLSLKNNCILEASGKGHSVLYENFKNDKSAFAQIIQKCDLLENQSTARLESASVYILSRISIEWAKKPENKCSQILSLLDDR